MITKTLKQITNYKSRNCIELNDTLKFIENKVEILTTQVHRVAPLA